MKKAKQTLFNKYGTYRPPIKRYFYDNQYFDSTWELAFWIYHKDHKIKIEREITKIYISEVNKNYIVDFTVNDTQLFEIKGTQFFLDRDETQRMIDPYCASKEANDYAELKHQYMLKNNVTIISKKEIQKHLRYIVVKYGKNYLDQYKIKSNSVSYL